MTITRRTVPLVDTAQRKQYSAFVHAVFTSKGRGLRQILPRVAEESNAREVTTWIAQQRLSDASLPRNLTAEQWAALFTTATRPAAATTPKRSGNGR